MLAGAGELGAEVREAGGGSAETAPPYSLGGGKTSLSLEEREQTGSQAKHHWADLGGGHDLPGVGELGTEGREAEGGSAETGPTSSLGGGKTSLSLVGRVQTCSLSRGAGATIPRAEERAELLTPTRRSLLSNMKINPNKKVINMKKYFENIDSCKPYNNITTVRKNQTEDDKQGQVVDNLNMKNKNLNLKLKMSQKITIKKKQGEELKKKESIKKLKLEKKKKPCDIKTVWKSPPLGETIPKFEPKLAPKLFAIFDRKFVTSLDIIGTLPTPNFKTKTKVKAL